MKIVERDIRGLERAVSLFPENLNEEKLWHAQKLKNAIIHPDTGFFLPLYLYISEGF